MLGVDQGEGNEVAPVPGPALEQGQTVDVRRSVYNLCDRPRGHLIQADLERLSQVVAHAPKLCQAGWHELVGKVGGALNELEWPFSKGQLDSFGASEEIGDNGESLARRILEQECRATRSNDAAVDFGNLQVWIDGNIDLDELAFLAEQVHKAGQISYRHDIPKSES